MQLIFDNLVSVLIASTVIAVVALLQIRSTQNGVEQVSTHAAKTKAMNFGEWLEDDIVSLGKNLGRDAGRLSKPDTLADGNTGYWEFSSDSLVTADSTVRHKTRYRLVNTGQRLIDDSVTVNLYQARRETVETPVNNGIEDPVTEAQWQEDGMSVATLSFFEISLLLADGEETDDPGKADFIRVRFAMVPEFDLENNYLQEYYWTTTLKVRPFWEPSTPSTGSS
jgi:hypothetical protein